MRNLFLTSSGITPGLYDAFQSLLPACEPECRAAFIPTAADPEPDRGFVAKARKELTDLDIDVRDVDLTKHTPESLRHALDEIEIIYVNGGNTFYLLDWARKSGFTKIVPELVKRGTIYVGTSAGSILACPTIATASWKHPDRNVSGLTDFTGLGLVPTSLVVHYTEKYRSLLEEKAQSFSYPFVAIADGQALRVSGERVRLVGPGPRLFYNGFRET